MILANGCNITKSEKFKGVWILSVPTVYIYIYIYIYTHTHIYTILIIIWSNSTKKKTDIFVNGCKLDVMWSNW